MAHLGRISLPLLARLPAGDLVEVGEVSFGLVMETAADGRSIRVSVDPTPAVEIADEALPTCPDCAHLQHSLYLIYRDARAPSTPCPEQGCGCTG